MGGQEPDTYSLSVSLRVLNAALCWPLWDTAASLFTQLLFSNETLIRRNGLPDGTDKRIQFILNTLIPRYPLSCPLSWQLLPLPDLTLSLHAV